MAMMVMANRSSTTARVSRKTRSAAGRWVLMTASTARANAMSVAVGIAQPDRRRAAGRSLRGRAARAPPCHRPPRRPGGPRGGVAQVARDELALQLQPGDEEEDREQPVGGPVLNVRSRCSAGGPDPPLRERRVGVAPGGVRPDQRERPRRRPAAARPRSRRAARPRSGVPRARSRGRKAGAVHDARERLHPGIPSGRQQGRRPGFPALRR